MPEMSVPPLVPSPTEGNIADYVVGWAEREPGRPMMAVSADGAWTDVSASELHGRVVALARGFVAAGLEMGDRVAIMSRTRLEWTLADFALWMVGAVPVPVYETSSRAQVEHILRDSRAVAAIVEDQAQTPR